MTLKDTKLEVLMMMFSYLPRYEEDDQQEIYFMGPEHPGLVPVRNTPEGWKLLANWEQNLGRCYMIFSNPALVQVNSS